MAIAVAAIAGSMEWADAQQHLARADSPSSPSSHVVVQVVPTDASAPTSVVTFNSRVGPEYPRDEMCMGIGGTATLLVSVGVDGLPLSVLVEHSSRDRNLDRAAISAAKTSTFHPKTENGNPVETVVRVPVNFNPFPVPTNCPPITTDVSPRTALQLLLAPKVADAVAIATLQRLAEHGDPKAQTRLGEMYEDGLGVERDPSMAMAWFNKSAAQGDGDAEDDLALMYDTGYGHPMDRFMSLHYFQKAAAHGNADGEFNLGMRYDAGDGVAQDAAKGASLVRLAAVQGYKKAQNRLGTTYYLGDGVPKDRVLALSWLILSGSPDGYPWDFSPEEHAEAKKLSGSWAAGRAIVHGTVN